ncbi:MAG TPA: hypothetical protein DCL77_01605 [Prolixibacteraceae bacterium]|jgi:hypothetical protein|nr:hypothetical protein [Prolixibacteraceae bacterium]
MRTFLVLLLCSSLVIVSCKKDFNNIPSADFIEITVNGQTYSNNLENSGSGFSGQGGCDNKLYHTVSLGQIEVAPLFLNVYIKHYGNDIDFKASKPGRYGITAIARYDVSALVEGCNLNLGVSYADKQLSDTGTTLQPGSKHNVTNIKEFELTKSEIGYSVSGTFSCSFKNSQGQTIPVTGKYQTTVFVLK